MTRRPAHPHWMEAEPPAIAPEEHLLRIAQWAREIGVRPHTALAFVNRAEVVGIPSPFRLIGKARFKRATRRDLTVFTERARAAGVEFPKEYGPRHREED